MIRKDNGRIYVITHSGNDAPSRTFQLKKKWFVCEGCKRYFLAEDPHLEQVSSINERETFYKRIESTRKSLEGKRIVFKEDGS